jgi:hypothetical protein
MRPTDPDERRLRMNLFFAFLIAIGTLFLLPKEVRSNWVVMDGTISVVIASVALVYKTKASPVFWRAILVGFLVLSVIYTILTLLG